jgi:hypothetical protein
LALGVIVYFASLVVSVWWWVVVFYLFYHIIPRASDVITIAKDVTAVVIGAGCSFRDGVESFASVLL